MSCPFGVGSIGFVMITYGISSSLFSFIGGKLSKLTGTILLIFIGKLYKMLLAQPKQRKDRIVIERVHTFVR